MYHISLKVLRIFRKIKVKGRTHSGAPQSFDPQNPCGGYFIYKKKLLLDY